MNSVVLRGSICYSTHPVSYIQDSIRSIRSWHDGEVIVSTWEGQEQFLKNVGGIDKIIISKDPGPGPIQHLRRQVISYENGINAAIGKKALVTRTDFVHHSNIFEHLDSEPLSLDHRFKIFQSRLVIGNMMCIDPRSAEIPNTFRLSDWFQAGNIEDIKNWGCVSHLIDTLDYSHFGCTEKAWFILFLIKNNISAISLRNTSSIDANYWDFILNNFIIKNTKSTLQSSNQNWSFQSEKLECYITEQLYDDMFKYKFNIQ
jgi:hypothetical protein